MRRKWRTNPTNTMQNYVRNNISCTTPPEELKIDKSESLKKEQVEQQNRNLSSILNIALATKYLALLNRLLGQ